MSSSTATRAQLPSRPTTSAVPAGPAPRGRTLAGPGCSVGGPARRPVLRIVADDGQAPVFTRVAPHQPPVSCPVAPVEPPRVRLDDFFAPEYDGDDPRLDIAGPRAGGVRLTRRGRVAVLVASVVTVAGLGLAAASASMASDHAEQTRVVTVAPGQTLWDISAAAGSGDVRSMMSHIEAINHLDSASLRAGQHLRIPR